MEYEGNNNLVSLAIRKYELLYCICNNFIII